MKSYILLVFAAFHTCQVISQGMEFDSAEFSKAPGLSFERSILPEKYSIEEYLPIIYPQAGSTCVAMSFALARTITFAIDNGIKDKEEITANSMSPYFIYYLARRKDDYSCNVGLSPIKAGLIAKEYGFSFLRDVEYPKYYPFSASYLCPNLFNFFPPVLKDDINNARINKVREVYVIKNLDGVKYALSHNMPVVIAIQIAKSFEELNSSLWEPLQAENRKKGLGGHAVVAIGYDDDLYGGAIRIANSWGEKWADSGKAWIRYSDLADWMDGAMVMDVLQKRSPNAAPKVNGISNSNSAGENILLKEFNQVYDFNNRKLLKAFEKYVMPQK
jgi:Papain family cysteine protease